MDPVFQRLGDVTIQRLDKPKENKVEPQGDDGGALEKEAKVESPAPAATPTTASTPTSNPMDLAANYLPLSSLNSEDDEVQNNKRIMEELPGPSCKKTKYEEVEKKFPHLQEEFSGHSFSDHEMSDYESESDIESDVDLPNMSMGMGKGKMVPEPELESANSNFEEESQEPGTNFLEQLVQEPFLTQDEIKSEPKQDDDYDYDIKEKLKEMGEISFETVKKGDSKPKKLELNETEVSVVPAKKTGNDEETITGERKGTNMRRNIREVMDETKLDESTLAAQRQEVERLRRVQEQQRLIREVQRQMAQERVISLLQGNNMAKAGTSSGTKIGNTVLVKLPNGQTKPMTKLSKKPLELMRVPKGSIPPHPKSRGSMLSLKRPPTAQTNLTPSVSIAPVGKRPMSYSRPPSESDSDGEEMSRKPMQRPRQREAPITTIDISSDDDCIVVSESENEPGSEDVEDPTNSGMHTNDEFNQPDEQGRVVINIGHPEDETDIYLAPQIARIIKPHQIGGIRFLYDNIIESTKRFETSTGFGCILAHSMGLGKTLQVVTFSDIFLRHTPARTILCIMPINTLQNWLAEYNMWLPTEDASPNSPLLAHGEVRPRNFNLHVLNDSHKTLAARAKVIHEWKTAGGVLLIGYEQYRLLSLKKYPKSRSKKPEQRICDEDRNKLLFEEVHEALVKPGPDLVICDEGHRIKNSHASISQALKQMRTKRRVVLTGYPLQNNLMEYWCMVDFVRPNYLGTKTEFCNMFERPIQNGQCIDSTEADIKLMRYRAHVLHSLLVGFVQRRSHRVLQTALPQKEEYVLLVRMTTFQRTLYETFMNEVVRTQTVPNPLKAFAVCCKIWNHPDVLYYFLKKQDKGEAVDIDLEEVSNSTGSSETPAKTKSRAKKPPKGKNAKPAASITPYNTNVTPDSSQQTPQAVPNVPQPPNQGNNFNNNQSTFPNNSNFPPSSSNSNFNNYQQPQQQTPQQNYNQQQQPGFNPNQNFSNFGNNSAGFSTPIKTEPITIKTEIPSFQNPPTPDHSSFGGSDSNHPQHFNTNQSQNFSGSFGQNSNMSNPTFVNSSFISENSQNSNSSVSNQSQTFTNTVPNSNFSQSSQQSAGFTQNSSFTQSTQQNSSFTQNSQSGSNFATNNQPNFAQNNQSASNFPQNSQSGSNFPPNNQQSSNFNQNNQQNPNYPPNSNFSPNNASFPPGNNQHFTQQSPNVPPGNQQNSNFVQPNQQNQNFNQAPNPNFPLNNNQNPPGNSPNPNFSQQNPNFQNSNMPPNNPQNPNFPQGTQQNPAMPQNNQQNSNFPQTNQQNTNFPAGSQQNQQQTPNFQSGNPQTPNFSPGNQQNQQQTPNFQTSNPQNPNFPAASNQQSPSVAQSNQQNPNFTPGNQQNPNYPPGQQQNPNFPQMTNQQNPNFPPANIQNPNFPAGNPPNQNFPTGNPPNQNFPTGNPQNSNFPPGNQPNPNFPSGNQQNSNFPPGGNPQNPNFPPGNSQTANFPQNNQSNANFPQPVSQQSPNFPPGNSQSQNYPPNNPPFQENNQQNPSFPQTQNFAQGNTPTPTPNDPQNQNYPQSSTTPNTFQNQQFRNNQQPAYPSGNNPNFCPPPNNQQPGYNYQNQNYWNSQTQDVKPVITDGYYNNFNQQQQFYPNNQWIKKEDIKPPITVKTEMPDVKPKINIISDIQITNVYDSMGKISPEKKINILSDIKLEPKKEEPDFKEEPKPEFKLNEPKPEVKMLEPNKFDNEDDIKLVNEAGPASKLPAAKEDTGIPYDWAKELMKDYIPGCIENSAKMEILFCIIKESLALGDRLLVFSQSLITLDLIEQFLQMNVVPGDTLHWAKNTNYYRLDGSTSALEREKLINEFNANPKVYLFLVSTRAGSLGINLIGANRVVVLDASWNPCHDTQAVCRVYRYGQRKPCFVYRLVVDNCLEKKIYDRQINKQGMSDRVVDECNPDAHLTMKDVSTLCWDDEQETQEQDWSHTKDNYIDVVLQKVLVQHGRRFNKEPFQHESLLIDRKDKQLSRQEKRLAKKGYEREKQAARQPSYNMTTGTRGHRPVASVRPMQQGGERPTRWIPAEHWQRQGMTAQEMTLPLDVVIPTNQPDKGNIVLKAGQKVLVLKSPKGVYMQLESGKIVAIKTAIKVRGKAEEDAQKVKATLPAAIKNNSAISVLPQKRPMKPFAPGMTKLNMRSMKQSVPNLVSQINKVTKKVQMAKTRPYQMGMEIAKAVRNSHEMEAHPISSSEDERSPEKRAFHFKNDTQITLLKPQTARSESDEGENMRSEEDSRGSSKDEMMVMQQSFKQMKSGLSKSNSSTALQQLEQSTSAIISDSKQPFQETLDSITSSYQDDKSEEHSTRKDSATSQAQPIQIEDDSPGELEESYDQPPSTQPAPAPVDPNAKPDIPAPDYGYNNYYGYNLVQPYPPPPPPQGYPGYPPQPPPYDMNMYPQQQQPYNYGMYPQGYPPQPQYPPPHPPPQPYDYAAPPPPQPMYTGYAYPQQYPPPPPPQGMYPPPAPAGPYPDYQYPAAAGAAPPPPVAPTYYPPQT